VETLLQEGWRLTTQGYVKGHWRIYCAQTWCVAVGIRMAEHNFKTEREAADWVNLVCVGGRCRDESPLRHDRLSDDARSERASVPVAVLSREMN
jgi:hypothetical protein